MDMNEFEKFLGKDLKKIEISDTKNFIIGEKKFGKIEKFFKNLPILKNILSKDKEKSVFMVVNKDECMFHTAVYSCLHGMQVKALSKINNKTGEITTKIISETFSQGKKTLGERKFKDESSWNAELLFVEKVVMREMLDPNVKPNKISFKGLTQEEIIKKMKEGLL